MAHRGPRICAAGAALAGAAAGVVQAEILYDTTAMTDNGTYDSFAESYVGGLSFFPNLRDEQAADDFELTGTYDITSVTGDFLTFLRSGAPAGGVLVAFFSDLGGTPSETPVAQVLSSSFTDTAFTEVLFGVTGHRITIDLSGDGISLGPGTWWMSIQPVDETPDGLRYRQLRTLGIESGFTVHGRDSGLAHGNGYRGTTYGSDTWVEFGSPQTSFDPGDLAMKIEGTLVEPPCPWDCDGNNDGIVSVTDLLALLGQYDPMSPKNCTGGACDFDNSGCVDVIDLLKLLAHYDPAGLGCP